MPERMQEVKIRVTKADAELLGDLLKNPPKVAQALRDAVKQYETNQAQASREKTILEVASSLVYGQRNKDYGHPIDNFGNIAKLQNAYLSIVSDRGRQRGLEVIDFNDDELSEIDIAIMNILQKVARLATNQTHMDSVVDIAGYAATIDRIINHK